MKVAILLTGCINPNGMSFTQLTDVEKRKEQYISAINYYLKETSCQVVFCENSNTDITLIFQDNCNKNRLEIITFEGNKDKQKGKGYGEAEIIEFAIHNSLVLTNCNTIIKITGRLIINNILNIVKSLKHKRDFVTCLFHSDLSFSDSRIFCATPHFYMELLNNKYQINDSEGRYFEHILSYTVLASKIQFIPFTEEPQISGVSGTSGNFYQAKEPTKIEKLLFKQYSLEQLNKINSISQNRHQNLFIKLLLMIKISIYKLQAKFTIINKKT